MKGTVAGLPKAIGYIHPCVYIYIYIYIYIFAGPLAQGVLDLAWHGNGKSEQYCELASLGFPEFAWIPVDASVPRIH